MNTEEQEKRRKSLLRAKKTAATLRSAIKPFIFFSEPVAGVSESELNYSAFSLVSLLSSPMLKAIRLDDPVMNVVLPLVWNYVDAINSVSQGVKQLLDEDHYQQKETKFRAYLNLFAGIQCFLLSYNPACTFFLGGPMVLASASFALVTLTDLIQAALDFYHADKEKIYMGYLEERNSESRFLDRRIKKVQEEIEILAAGSLSQKDEKLLDREREHLESLKSRKQQLDEKQWIRYKVHCNTLALNQDECDTSFSDKDPCDPKNAADFSSMKQAIIAYEGFLYHWNNEDKRAVLIQEEFSQDGVLRYRPMKAATKISENTIVSVLASLSRVSAEEREIDHDIQVELDEKYNQSARNIALRALSFIGMTLMAIGTFALISSCPASVALVGFFITLSVATAYLYRHAGVIKDKIGSIITKEKDEPSPLASRSSCQGELGSIHSEAGLEEVSGLAFDRSANFKSK